MEMLEEEHFNCAICTGQENIFAVEQINDMGQIISIVFICEKCMEQLEGKKIVIGIVDEDNENVFDGEYSDDSVYGDYQNKTLAEKKKLYN